MLDVSFSLTLRPALTLAVAETSSRLSPRPIGRRCVVTAASDTTVASRAGAARLLRTKPQVRLMVLSISNDYLSDFHVARRVREWHCCHSLPSEPDVNVSVHPAQAVAKPCVSRAGIHDGLIPASHRWMPNRLRNARSSKYGRQRGSNGLAVPLICGCRRILVSAAWRSFNQTIWPLGVRSPVSTANTQLRWPMVCQYLRITHWLDLFGCRRLAQRQRLCHNTWSTLLKVPAATMDW